MRGHGLPCEYCKREMRGDVESSHPLRATKDHTIPRSKRNGRGGPHLIVMACFTCNQIKADRFPEQWERFMKRNPRWWEHPLVTGRPRKAPVEKPDPLPLEHSRYILAHGKKAYRRWVDKGCPPPLETLRPLHKDEPIPIEYDDPIKQAAFEAAYKDRRYLLRVPAECGGLGQSSR